MCYNQWHHRVKTLKIAVTGGNGFAGKDFIRALQLQGEHQIVVVARRAGDAQPSVSFEIADINNAESLVKAFAGCDAVVHCAGINKEVGEQTYERVHVQGTANVVSACKHQGIRKVVLTSFLKARPGTDSAYHESKWQAEELCRKSDLDYTVLKPGVIYGKGDHMISHMAKALMLSPVFGLIGGDVALRPIALQDFSQVLIASLHDRRMDRATYAVLGGEKLLLSEAARRVAGAMKRPVLPLPMPAMVGYALAGLFEKTMKDPLLAASQITMIAEGLADTLPGESELPEDLRPQSPFSTELIKASL